MLFLGMQRVVKRPHHLLCLLLYHSGVYVCNWEPIYDALLSAVLELWKNTKNRSFAGVGLYDLKGSVSHPFGLYSLGNRLQLHKFRS